MNYVLTPNAVNKIRRAIAPRSGNGGAVAARGLSIDLDKFPPPFTVRWSQSENSGVGAWVIWLPSTPTLDMGGQQRIILIGDQYYQINSLNSASGLPPGWYILPNSASGGDVWFNVTYPYRIGSSSIVAGAIQTARAFRPEDQVDGYYKISVHIASMATDATTGAKKVYQFVDSLINLAQLPMAPGGSGSEGGDVVYPTPFELSRSESSGGVISLSIINRTFFWDGKLIPNQNVPDAPGFSIPATGSVYLRCVGTKQPSSSDADENGFVWTFSIGAAPANEGDQRFNYILYTFTNGEVELDYRDTFLALYSGAKTVEPDDVSTEFIPDAPSGSTPAGDEGKLQIKGFKAGTPADANNIAQYLQGAAQLPSAGLFLVARVGASAGGSPTLKYIPLSTIFTNQSGDLTVEFVADNDWDSTNHILRKRLRVLNLRTGAVTDKANTTYANGWEVMAQTTGISTILSRQSGSGSSSGGGS